MSRETKTDKLGAIVKQPDDSKFKLERRLSDWRPDTQNDGKLKFYPEESLLKPKGDTNEFEPFQPPKTNGKAFEEPKPFDPDNSGNAKQWFEFNSAILGSKIPDPAKNDFDNFLTVIARRVRRYNAALYWMRRLHFHENAEHVTAPPPRNPHGDKEPNTGMPDKKSPDFEKLVGEAEREWGTAVDELNDLLAGGGDASVHFEFTHTKADMIEVNGYIVSMRVISQKKAWTKQVGGSSSSHIYISSAFSSS